MVYVILQFILLLVVVWPSASLTFSIVGLLLLILSAFIAVSALVVNRPGNFNVRPHPKTEGALVVNGPYRLIRHPMYSSLFFGCLGVLFFQFGFLKLVAWLLLIAVLTLKARIEEKALCEHHPDYREYQKTNKSFIPWIW